LLVRGEGSSATLEAGAIAAILTFEPGDGGALVPKIDRAKKVAALESRLTQTEKGGAEAPLVFDGDRPSLKPSKPGRVIDWDAGAVMLDVLKRTDHRVLEHERAHPTGRHHLVLSLANALRAVLSCIPLFRQAPAALRELVELAATSPPIRVESSGVADPELFCRGTQHVGLLVATALTGFAIGILFAVVYGVFPSRSAR
jgi:hypothetical protein